MNWELVPIIVIGVIALFIVCCFIAAIDEGLKLRRERKIASKRR